MGRALKLSLTAALLAVALLAFAFVACGKHGVVQGLSPGSSDAVKTSPEGLDYQGALAELDALECPEGVDSALWGELKSAFRTELTKSRPGSPARLLDTSEESGAKAPRTGSLENHGRDAHATKIVATPPQGEANRVNDLAITDNGDGTYTLAWHYRNMGDYDQNGVVEVDDIIPLAQHFGQSVPEDDTERNSIQAVIDGSGNGRVGIEDVTPIAVNFQREVARYVIEGAEGQSGPWEPVGEVLQNEGSGESRIAYAYILADAPHRWYRVVPYDSEGVPDGPSEATELFIPNQAPVAVLVAEPLTGEAPLAVTFDASGSYDPDGTIVKHVWDWDGDGLYDWDSGSHAKVQHTFSTGGVNSVQVTVTDEVGATGSDGVTIAVTYGWVHTWGGTSGEWTRSVAVDTNLNVYVAGATESFGAGYYDVFLLKYAPDGSLLRQQTWGGNMAEIAHAVAVNRNGGFCICGSSQGFGVGSLDVFLLKYSPDGQLVWQRTWGSHPYDIAYAVTQDGSENVYVTGLTSGLGAGSEDTFLLRFNRHGELHWQRTWGGPSSEDARALALDASGSIYVAGRTKSFGAGDYDALLLKYSPDGQLQWQRTWGGEQEEGIGGVCVGGNGCVYVAGRTSSFGAGEEDAMVLSYSSEGELLWQSAWGSDLTDNARSLVVDSDGSVFVAGYTDSFNTDGDVFLLKYSSDGSLLWQRTWNGESKEYVSSLAVDSNGALYLAGAAPDYSGSWQEVSGVITPVLGTETVPSGSECVPFGLLTFATGTETTPMGTEDVGGGEADVLIMKVDPSRW